jgi:ZIP family zinc transporter
MVSELSGLALVGTGLIAAATIAGAWLASRRHGHREISFAAAAGALLIMAVLHLLPDAWEGAGAARIWPPLVPMAAFVGFIAASLAARTGCGCREHSEQASGSGAAAALTIHRLLEGSAVVLIGSTAVAVGLAVHAFGEGLATAALLSAQSRRMVGWLALMCISPLVGAVAASAVRVPAAAEPVPLALAAGVIAQAAWVSLRAAFRGLGTSRVQLFRPAVAVALAAIITTLAVHAAG